MDYKLLSIIKKEKEEIIEDNNDNYLQFDLSKSFDVRVKIENETIEDWCIPNVLSTNCLDTTRYETLKEECVQSCVMCCESFNDRFSLYKHNLTHLKVPLIQHSFFMCDACPSFYDKKNDLEDHIATTHQGKSLYNGKNLITRSLHKCEICKKVYPYKSWFEHIRTVHNQLRIQCDKCDMLFKHERYLKRHILHIHEGKKPPWRRRKPSSVGNDETIDNVKCPKCPRTFSFQTSLTTHLKNCHSENTFQCKICKSMLKCKAYLLSHMRRVHYDDGKMHYCNICGKGFKSPRYVKIHIKNSHISPYRSKKNKS